ncbi:MAG: SIMPL domain-containing protein [Burkholderiaceae bacterium]
MKPLLAGTLLLVTLMASAQTALPEPRNVAQLSANATVEVQQDWLVLNMNTTRDGTDAAMVQNQLKQALDTALQQVRKLGQPGQLDVRTGNFNLFPQHNREGRITGWQGTTELVLEGRDFARIAAAAGKVQTLTMAGVSFSLSPEQRARAQDEAQALAIGRFKAQAADIAKGFGFSGYSLREVSVNANDQGFAPRPRMLAMQAKDAAADAPVPMEPGKSAVVVTVSGSVQLK